MKEIMSVKDQAQTILNRFGVAPSMVQGGDTNVFSPLTGECIAALRETTPDEAQRLIQDADQAFRAWRETPAPARGELVRLFGQELRMVKEELGRLVTIEAGKIPSEGLGEVQEMIDICDFAVGLSRQLYGLTISTERPGHRMMETWHPIGAIGVISAFNFPVAVWAWNAALALVCGNSVIWKPSEKTPLTALACEAIFQRAVQKFPGRVPAGLTSVLLGGSELGAAVVDSPLVPVVSATGSTRMGRDVAPRVARRFGRLILELGGNNAGIVCPSADLEMTVRAVAFSAMGTAGQRCTTMRRAFVHERVYADFVARLKKAYASVAIGNPLDGDCLVGPLIDHAAYEAMQSALEEARRDGGDVLGGARVDGPYEKAFYVQPALVEMPAQTGIVEQETFAPILYVMRFDDFDDVLRRHNAVGAGLSSAIFTTDIREAEAFLSARGSDCGIANVNIGTSGAEIGGAFGGEKETGGGRESGSDAWKAYMRRATNTINYSRELPLAQGVSFDIR